MFIPWRFENSMTDSSNSTGRCYAAYVKSFCQCTWIPALESPVNSEVKQRRLEPCLKPICQVMANSGVVVKPRATLLVFADVSWYPALTFLKHTTFFID